MPEQYYNDFRIEPKVVIHDSRLLWPITITMIDITVGPWKYPSEYWVKGYSEDGLASLDPRLPEFWRNNHKFVHAIWHHLNIHINARVHWDGSPR